MTSTGHESRWYPVLSKAQRATHRWSRSSQLFFANNCSKWTSEWNQTLAQRRISTCPSDTKKLKPWTCYLNNLQCIPKAQPDQFVWGAKDLKDHFLGFRVCKHLINQYDSNQTSDFKMCMLGDKEVSAQLITIPTYFVKRHPADMLGEGPIPLKFHACTGFSSALSNDCDSRNSTGTGMDDNCVFNLQTTLTLDWQACNSRWQSN